MPKAQRADLTTLLSRFKPKRLLTIGKPAQQLAQTYREQCGDAELVALASNGEKDLAGLAGRFDVAIISEIFDAGVSRSAENFLARLRDVYAERLLVLVAGRPAVESSWRLADWLSLGFYHVAVDHQRERSIDVYLFDITNYEVTPDWLNAKYWAHPELFDKHWW